MARLRDLQEDELTPEQALVFEAIRSGPRGEVAEPLRAWLHSPGLAAKAQTLGQYCRYDSNLPPALSELAILVTGRIWSAGFEWAHHAPIAQDAGVPVEAIEAISHARRVTFDDPKMQAVFDFVVELHRDRHVRASTFAAAQDVLGAEPLVDLVGLCGYYGLISMTINAFELPDGDGPVLPVIERPVHEYFRDEPCDRVPER